MTENRGVLREISWRDICPWLIIFRTFGLATSLPILFLATVGALVTPLGWRVGEALFVKVEDSENDPVFRDVLAENGRWPGEPAATLAPNAGFAPASVREVLVTSPDTVQPVFLRFERPARSLLEHGITVTRAAYYVFGLLWLLVVWGGVGGAITRIAAVRLGREERIGLGEAMRFARQRLGGYVASPLFPVLGIAFALIPAVLLGVLLRWDWGVPVAGVLWLVALLGGMVAAVLLLGLLFGWPLMWGTISCEKQGDAFEAFSRSYSYVFQRPLHYLFYATVGVAFGALGWLLVYHFSETVLHVTEWAASLTASSGRWEHLTYPGECSDAVAFGVGAMDLAAAFVRSIAAGFGYGLFWCLAAAIYLLLRRDTDRTEFDEVYVENENRNYQLPSLDVESPGTAGGPVEPPA